MDRVYEYEITGRAVFEMWAIRTYLHKRLYNVLYPLAKIIPIVLFFSGGIDSTYEIFYNIFLFFYFDIYIFYRYISIKKRVETIYGEERMASLILKSDELEFKSRNSQTVLFWKEISKVKQTRWFFLLYKDDLVVATIYKRVMKKDDLDNVTEYFTEQSKNYKHILFI